MPHISDKVLEQSIRGIFGLLRDHQEKMEMAYCNEEDTLSVSIGLKYSIPRAGNGIQIDTNLSFVLEKIKANTTAVVDPNRDSLFTSQEFIDGIKEGIEKDDSITSAEIHSKAGVIKLK